MPLRRPSWRHDRRSGILAVVAAGTRGLGLLDLVVVLAVLSLLVWVVRLDWSKPEPPASAPVAAAH